MTIQLYDLCGEDRDRRFSPYCWRIKLALAAKDMPYETVATPFTAIGSALDGRISSLPAMVDDGQLITDSFAMAEHLDETYDQGMPLFDGPQSVALSRFINDWTYSALHRLIMRMIIADVWSVTALEDREYFRSSREGMLKRTLEDVQSSRDEARDLFQKTLTPLRLMLEKQSFLSGDRVGYADMIVAGSFLWIVHASDYKVLAGGDPVDDWFQRVQAACGLETCSLAPS